jgi:hypothetical protein
VIRAICSTFFCKKVELDLSINGAAIEGGERRKGRGWGRRERSVLVRHIFVRRSSWTYKLTSGRWPCPLHGIKLGCLFTFVRVGKTDREEERRREEEKKGRREGEKKERKKVRREKGRRKEDKGVKERREEGKRKEEDLP